MIPSAQTANTTRVRQNRATFVPQLIFFASLILGGLTLEPLIVIAGVIAAMVANWIMAADQLPVMLFCLAYQMVFIVTGICYRGFFGIYPSDHQPPRVDLAVVLLLAAFFAMSLGIRVAMHFVANLPSWQKRWSTQAQCDYSIRKLFWWTIAVFAVGWVLPIDPRQLSSAFGQVIGRILEFRLVFVYLLFVMILRARRHYWYGLVAAIVVAVPAVTTGGSGFAQVLIVFLVALISEGSFLSHLGLIRNRRRLFLTGFSGCLLVCLALLWTGAVKAPWRQMIREGQLSPTVTGKVKQFFALASETIPKFDFQTALWNQSKRVSDVPILMAMVVDRVPSVMSHENGQLTLVAVKHVLMPRFFFPNKASLGSDSVLVRRYTGLYVAGEESGASIGLGYLIEFYIDYGLIGMMVAAFFFGALVGGAYRWIYFLSPSKELYVGVLIAIMLNHFMSFDGSLAKICGGLIMAFVVETFMLLVIGKRLHRLLSSKVRFTTRIVNPA